jgi:hypothetical protein
MHFPKARTSTSTTQIRKLAVKVQCMFCPKDVLQEKGSSSESQVASSCHGNFFIGLLDKKGKLFARKNDLITRLLEPAHGLLFAGFVCDPSDA